MVVRVAEQAKRSGAQSVIVATDSDEIQAVCNAHRIECLLTQTDHPTGTDRIAEVAQLLKLPADALIVNVQGDEPLIPPELINQVALALAAHSQCAIATVATPITDPAEINNPNVVKVVLNRQNEAMYFSRSASPFERDAAMTKSPYLRHLGVYAYRASFLAAYTRLEVAPLEQAESLEQLRALWHGFRIQVHITEDVPPPGVDTEADLERVRLAFASRG
jgi:3-deoxy-manno-octulosonate cytidylyltransferase (CMP-KDO synthetase)